MYKGGRGRKCEVAVQGLGRGGARKTSRIPSPNILDLEMSILNLLIYDIDLTENKYERYKKGV